MIMDKILIVLNAQTNVSLVFLMLMLVLIVKEIIEVLLPPLVIA